MDFVAPDELQKKNEELQRRVEELEGRLSAGSPASTPEPAPSTPVAPEGGMDVASVQEGDATLRRMIKRIAMILQAEKIVIMFYESEKGELVGIPPAYGVDEDAIGFFRVRATQGISGEVFRSGVPAIFHDAGNDPRTYKENATLFHITNGISVPLVIEKRDDENRVTERQSIGVLHAFNKRHNEDFNDEDVRLLERMAKNVGAIIANLRLYKLMLEKNEELIQTFESLTSGLIFCGPEGNISQANASARAILQLPTDTVGRPYNEVISDEGFQKLFSEGLAGNDPLPVEVQVDVQGAERFYTCQGALVKNDDGKMLGFVVIMNDITEQKHVDKMKSGFVAMASHELRTPLTAIKGFSSTLLEGVDDQLYGPEEQKEFLGIVVSECDRLRRLIDDLLNTARIEANESLKPNYTEFELVPLLDKVVRVQNQASTRHVVKLEVHEGDIPKTILGDEDKFDQILTNLLNNAIKYSPDGGDVIVHLWRRDDQIRIGVQDPGIGIPADQLTKVFERFHRVNNDDNRKIYGTGLGLFLVKHLVEKVHMGRIWAESEVGVGSTFLFEIPAEMNLEEALAFNE